MLVVAAGIFCFSCVFSFYIFPYGLFLTLMCILDAAPSAHFLGRPVAALEPSFQKI